MVWYLVGCFSLELVVVCFVVFAVFAGWLALVGGAWCINLLFDGLVASCFYFGFDCWFAWLVCFAGLNVVVTLFFLEFWF